jgi:hypothetical protein
MSIRERAGDLLNLFTQHHTNITDVSPKKDHGSEEPRMDLSIMKINGKYHMDRNAILEKKYKIAASTVIGERCREHVRMSSILPRISTRRKGRGS